MSDAVDRLAQALRDVISEAVQEAVEPERETPPPAQAVEHPNASRRPILAHVSDDSAPPRR
jgi:hypothetical protein